MKYFFKSIPVLFLTFLYGLVDTMVLEYSIFGEGSNPGLSSSCLISSWSVSIHRLRAKRWRLLTKWACQRIYYIAFWSNSFAQSRIYDRHYTQFVEKDAFQPGFVLNLLHKDLVLVKKMADDNGAALPIEPR